MLKEEIIANRGYAIFQVKENDQLDEIAVRVLRQDCPDFLLPFKTISMDGEMEFRYELADGVRMSYQQPRISKREFVQQMIGMLLPFKNCGDWLLDYHNICLDPQYIFINTKEQAVRYIYLPVGSCRKSDREIKDFFINFALSVELQDDKNFVLQILRLLRDEHSNLITVLEFFQNEVGNSNTGVRPAGENKSQVHADREYAERKESEQPKAQEASRKQLISRPESQKTENQESKGLKNWFSKNEHSSEEKPAENLFEKQAEQKEQTSGKFGQSNIEEQLLQEYSKTEKKKKKEKKEKEKPADKENKKGWLDSLLSKKKDKKDEQDAVGISRNMPPAEYAGDLRTSGSQSAPLPESNASSGHMTGNRSYVITEDTTEMENIENEDYDSPVLRLRLEDGGGYTAPRDIELNVTKGFVTVGRYDKSGYPCADFNFDHSLTFISRNHFRIEKSGDGYVIIDLDSKNGTLLNGRELVKNMAYPLNAGDIIAMSRKVRLAYRVL